MIVLDATKITEPQNADEQLAYFLCYAEPDDLISIHGNWCRTHLDAAFECTCVPRILRLGAKA
jgi:hypothetical protein